MKYLNGGTPSKTEDFEKALQIIAAYYHKYNRQFGLWFAEEKETGECIGWFLLRPDKKSPNDLKNPEFGYRFKKKFWGKGYATEGSLALLKKAFTELDCEWFLSIQTGILLPCWA